MANKPPNDLEKQKSIIVKDGCYYYQVGQKLTLISNFTMKVLFFIQNNANPIRVVELTNNQGATIQFDMPADAMRNADTFCKTLEGKGNYLFNGGKPALSALKVDLFKDEKTAIDLMYLGYQKRYNVYAFCNGMFDHYGKFHIPDTNGIATIGEKQFYLPLSNDNASLDDETEFQPQKLFAHKPGYIKFEDWAEVFIDVYGVKGFIGICYVLAAANRDIIFELLHCMPHLFLSGKPQSGKSTFRRGLMAFFGNEQKPIQLGMGSTQKALSRKLGQFANALVSAEEYKNDIDPRLIETLKGIYDGEGYERAKRSNDNQTHTTSVLSSLILTGQQLPTRENALFSRCNLLEFAQTEFTPEEVQKFEKLKRIQAGGLTHLTGQLFNHHKLVRENFQKTFSDVDHQLRSRFAGRTIADRIINNYVSIITPFLILQKSGVYDFSFIKLDVMQEIENIIADQVEHLNATTEINQFWYVIKLLIEKNDAMLESTHYIFRKHKTTGKICLGIRFQSVADLYRDYCLKRRLPNILDDRTLSSYLKQDKAFVPGTANGGCHYATVGGDKKSFFYFDMNHLPADMREIIPDSKEFVIYLKFRKTCTPCIPMLISLNEKNKIEEYNWSTKGTKN